MKKLLSGLLTIVMFFALITTMALIGVRGAIGTNNVEKILELGYEEYGESGTFLGVEMEGYEEELLEDKEAKKLMSSLVSDALKYYMRITDKEPDFEPFLEYVVEETDVDIDDSEIEEIADEMIEYLDEDRLSEDDEGVAIVQMLFSTTLLIGAILVVVVCVVAICALTKNVQKGVKRLGSATAAAGLAVYGLSSLLLMFATNQASASEEQIVSFMEILFSPFGTVGVVSLILGIVLALLSPKIAQTFASIDHSNQAIQNLDDSVIKR